MFMGGKLYSIWKTHRILVMFDAILFDNDGILVDTECRHVQACQEMVRKLFDLEYSLEDYQQYGYTNGTGTSGWLRDQEISETDIERFQKLRNERYEVLLKDPIEPMSGVRALLQFVQEKHIPRALVTATPRPHLELAHSQTGLLSSFAFTICNQEVPRSKPFPDGYLAAAKQLRVDPGKCLVLEDSPRGVVAGKEAGMTVWAVPSGQTKMLDFSRADEVFESLEEVLEKLKRYHP